jgi:xylan 1,4-beta-xylosidase
MNRSLLLFASAVCVLGDVAVTVDVDLSPVKATAFPHYWKKSFGSGHGTLTLRSDWQAHLKQAVADLGLQGVRHHGLFDDDMGVVTAPGEYNFSKVGASWDYQLSLGLTPIVELSFMPCILAGCSWHGLNNQSGLPKCHHLSMAYQGIIQPPTDFNDWYNLVVATAKFAVSKYGLEEVRTWHFEVWNELWGMTFPTDYMKLFNASSHALKSVDSKFKVGGPATAQLKNVKDFVDQCKALDIPFDFVSTHMYPTDPQCKRGAGWDPDCLTNNVKEARQSVADYPFFMTEYNVGCCLGYSQHDTSAAAAFAFKQVGALAGVVDVLSWWTFT